MLNLKTTAFHERTSALCQPQNWRKWAGYFAAGSYEHTLDREYWAIRNSAALIDVTPLIKYIIQGKDAAALLHRVTTRDIYKMKVGQVFYTGWCDEEGKLIDDGTVSRLDEDTFRLTAAEPNLRWLLMNAVGMQVAIREVTDDVAALSFQGPNSRKVLNKVTDTPVDGLKYFRLIKNRICGREVTISRTGYTGDLGYEIWMDNGDALAVWDGLMDAGADY
ncbi:MAG TPA: aminomethyltransferase family protein, partial [Anaerolineales bacterium]|nr:aminomethyltransferase family protein [Anaerolineales bacterium]